MTDPIYGNSPLDVGAQWDGTWLTPLNTDPFWIGWRNVWVAALTEANESQWLMRWRRAVTTAEGQQLIDRGLELGFAPKPAGWTDERYRDVLVAIVPGAYATPTDKVYVGIADALTFGPQTFVFREELPLSMRVTFTDTSADEAINYRDALEYGRPHGSQFFIVSHRSAATTFRIGSSPIGGPHTIGTMIKSTGGEG